MTNAVWEGVLQEFNGCCAFCAQGPTQENRGIVPDHLIPVTQFGELVVGNTVPACQTCNDSRGDGNWRAYLETRFPEHAARRIAAIDEVLKRHPYQPVPPEEVLTPDEQQAYQMILREWEGLMKTASELYAKVKARRGIR